MIITITPAALTHLRQCVSDQPTCVGVHLGIKPSGCVGNEYTFEYMYTMAPNMISVDDNNIVFIRAGDGSKVYGSTLDYITNGLQQSLCLENPNEVRRCGCGKSVAFEVTTKT